MKNKIVLGICIAVMLIPAVLAIFLYKSKAPDIIKQPDDVSLVTVTDSLSNTYTVNDKDEIKFLTELADGTQVTTIPDAVYGFKSFVLRFTRGESTASYRFYMSVEMPDQVYFKDEDDRNYKADSLKSRTFMEKPYAISLYDTAVPVLTVGDMSTVISPSEIAWNYSTVDGNFTPINVPVTGDVKNVDKISKRTLGISFSRQPDSAVITVRVGESFIPPETVPAIFTDGSRAETAVTWDEGEVRAVTTDAVAKFVIHGVGDGKSALCYVNVVEANYLENYSFEDKDLSVWTITPLAAEPQADFQVKATDAYTGDVSLHFWNGAAVEFRCEQTVRDLPAGTWRISVRGQGGDVGDDADIHLYVIADGETYTAPLTFTGWVDWHEALIEHVPCVSGEVTVGVYVRCRGGGWGTFDDFLLNPEK